MNEYIETLKKIYCTIESKKRPLHLDKLDELKSGLGDLNIEELNSCISTWNHILALRGKGYLMAPSTALSITHIEQIKGIIHLKKLKKLKAYYENPNRVP